MACSCGLHLCWLLSGNGVRSQVVLDGKVKVLGIEYHVPEEYGPEYMPTGRKVSQLDFASMHHNLQAKGPQDQAAVSAC